MRRYFILILLALAGCLALSAQTSMEEINSLKLSGKYFTAEATAATEQEAYEAAKNLLLEKVLGYCEEMEIPEIDIKQIEPSLKKVNMERGDDVFVFIYVPRTVVTSAPSSGTQHQSSVTYHPTPNTHNPSSITYNGNVPPVIKSLCEIETFAGLQNALQYGKSEGLISEYGKARVMTDTESCYLVMVNRDLMLVGVLTPKVGGVRRNVASGATLSDEEMKKTFVNCAPVCVRLK